MKRLLLLALLVLPASAGAGLISALSEEERQIWICRDAAAEAESVHDYARALGVWQACLGECERLGYTGALPMLRDQVAITEAMSEASEWRASDPHRFALEVLTVAAGQDSTEYPTPAVAETFRTWMTTEAGRGRVSAVRTVTVDWVSAKADRRMEPSERARIVEVFRRHVEDLGLKWAEPGSPDVDVILYARLDVVDLEPRQSSRVGSLPRAQATLTAERLRFPALDRTDDGFVAVAAAESGDATQSREEALDGACERGAAHVLKHVLRAAFGVEE